MEDEVSSLSLLAGRREYSTEIFWNMEKRTTCSCQQQASCVFHLQGYIGNEMDSQKFLKTTRELSEAGWACAACKCGYACWWCQWHRPQCSSHPRGRCGGPCPGREAHFCWVLRCHGWPTSTPKGSSNFSATVQPAEEMHIILGNTLERGVNMG